MNITTTIRHIRGKLLYTFGIVDSWFDCGLPLLQFQPAHDRWSIAQILEHISLTNYYLLILIRKATAKAIAAKEKQSVAAALSDYRFRRQELDAISIQGSFAWPHPVHMEPVAEMPLATVRRQIKQQVNECLSCLELLSDGAGVLYRTMMTVNQLGKLDVYEYIYFLAMHGARHMQQMQQNASAFEAATISC